MSIPMVILLIMTVTGTVIYICWAVRYKYAERS